MRGYRHGRSTRVDHFRLDFERPRKRAKDLLHAARNDEALRGSLQLGPGVTMLRRASLTRSARSRMSWAWNNGAALRRHIVALDRQRAAFTAPPPDSGVAPCTCAAAATSMMACMLPASVAISSNSPIPTPAARWAKARSPWMHRVSYILESGGTNLGLTHDALHARLCEENARLQQSAQFERVVIWSEHDVHDQLALLRYLAHYATQGTPPQLELIKKSRTFPAAAALWGWVSCRRRHFACCGIRDDR